MNRKQRRGDKRFGGAPASGQTGAPTSGTAAQLFAAAAAQHQAGAYAEAERRYRYILSLFPDHADSLNNLGLLMLQAGNPAAAAELIGKAIKLNDRVAQYHYNIALAWRALDKVDEVAAHLERAAALRPDQGLTFLNLGNARRQQGRLAEAIACYERASALIPNSAAAHVNLANIFSEQGRWDDATAAYRRALALEPNNAETHHHFGSALMAQGKSREAVAQFRAAVALRPDVAVAYEGLGAALLSVGEIDAAIDAVVAGLERHETPHGQALFAQCVKSVRFTAKNERLCRLVFRALVEGWSRPRDLDSVCISIVKLDPIVNACIARAVAARPERLDAAALFGDSGLAALAADELLAALLQCDPIPDGELECLLTNVRTVMLAAAGNSEASTEQHLNFYAAVARQCFINEYVYPLHDGEAERARELQSRLVQALQAGDPVPALWPIAVGAYMPLHTIAGADALLSRAWSESVEALLVQQIKQPRQERDLAAAIPTLTAINDDVSRAVRQQYEENPYPRWIKTGPPFQPAILRDNAGQPVPDILIAGCGTGLSAVEFARQMRNSRILAIDLSLASLSYAKRMAQSFGVENIEFAQADIMELGSLGRGFDFIDSSGVLHHLADPWAGWKILLSLLRPGGVMQVGLYSELARSSVVAARALIAEHGYPATADGIRRARQYIMTADEALLKSVAQWCDIYTISECRDLLFHVQEHRTTLPQIKSFLAANGVQFSGFIPEPSLLRRFEARFPQAALLDLDCWHSLETEAPELFAAMYQFWVRKPAADEPRKGSPQ